MNSVSGIKRWPAVHHTMLVIGVVLATVACTPTVKVATDEPITINLNVNIKHEILVKVDKQLDDLFSKDSGLF
jgi:YnbE-like lipoprotein